MKRNTTTLAALALASALALTACGGTGAEDNGAGSESTPAASSAAATSTATDTAAPSATATGSAEEISAEHNDADVMFAQMMLPHHEQAVEMSEMLLAKDNVPAEVADFAQQVIDAQGPEIERMNAMLTAWDAEPMAEMEGMDHGGMSGMMSEEDMAALEEAQGTEAARLYLEQMTAHHEGAVDMAQDQVDNGQNPQAVALAEQVITAQEAEIAEMEQMLGNL
ncbi:hypothetical protein GCM10010977_29650 [Citricoccus zhacaiensis]|uniref:DUF305 domain-containing protein n=3 Tax=Citricoccus TaxID=169133 RepID=A0ABV5G9B6_9MICC|nr:MULTISPECIES: DUF305 domain-containing protein [Citricoccus]GGO48924.1 hypothetical protein GCM10010977_29650 [Citricoccus zhacaiensis]VXC14342.1 conserved exported hypothetical protein [Citricoccus sp. K5]